MAYLNPRAGKPLAFHLFRAERASDRSDSRYSPERVALPLVAASSLKNPPPLATNALRIIPLGGLGDIGRNMAVLEFDGQLLLIDCGVLFPEDHHPGRRPDPARLRRHRRPAGRHRRPGAHPRPRGPHRRRALPAAAAADHPADRLQADPGPADGEVPRAPAPQRRPARWSPTASGSSSAASTLSSSRSTTRSRTRSRWPSGRRPGPCCTPATSRWTSCRWTAGSPTCARSPGSARRASTCSWSTRPTPRCPASPRRSATSPRPWTGLRRSKQRVIVACFASHVHRVQQVLDAAVAHGRKVVYVGRSMVRNMGVARDLGYLHVPANTLIELRDIDKYRPQEVVIISTGSQGEPLSALSRMANREHPVIPLKRGRHRRAGQLADPGQRERGLPGDQRAEPAGRPGGAQGQRAGARLRPRQRRRAAVLLQHRPPAQRDAGARRGPAPDRQRRPGRRHRRAAGADDHRRGRRGGRPAERPGPDRRQGRRRLHLRRRQHASATSPRPR